MAELHLKQLKYDAETWKRSLEYIIEENIHLKKRLTELLKSGYDDSSFLKKAEYFQNQFIKEDELVELIRDDLVQIEKSLARESIDNREIMEVENQLERLRNNMHHAETHITKVKLNFSNYLHGILIKF